MVRRKNRPSAPQQEPAATPAPVIPDMTAAAPAANKAGVRRGNPWAARNGGWLAMLLAFCLFAPSFGFDYIYDDIEIVKNNFRIQNIANPSAYLLTDWWNNIGFQSREYRPAALASFALNHWLSGGRPSYFHAVNVLLYAACAGAFWLLLNALFRRPKLATAAALLFAAHPLHVECVAGIVGRAELIMALFFCLALLAAWRFIEIPSLSLRARWGLPGAVFLCTLLSISSKEHGVLLPPLTALLLLLPPAGACEPGQVWTPWVAFENARPRWRRALAVWGAMALALAIYFAARRYTLGAFLKSSAGGISAIDNPLVFLPFIGRELTALSILMRALVMMVFPLWLSPDYSANALKLVNSADDPMALAGALFLILAAAGVWRLRRRPAAWFGLVWTGLTYLVASNLIVLIGTIFGERLLFLPSAGFCLLLAAFLFPREHAAPLAAEGSPHKRVPLGLVFFLILMAAYVGRTSFYLQFWKDTPTLFCHAVREVPDSARALHIYATVLADRKQLDDAEAHEQRAIAIAPEYSAAVLGLAEIHERQNRIPDAIDLLRRFHFSSPGEPTISKKLADLLERQGNISEAGQTLLDDYAAQPRNWKNALNLGLWLLNHGRVADARRYLEQARPGLSPADWARIEKNLSAAPPAKTVQKSKP